MRPRWSRLDLTPLLDILLNTFLIVLVQLDFSGREATIQARDEAGAAHTQVETLTGERDALAAERDDAEQRWRDAETGRLDALSQAARMAEILTEAGRFGNMTAEEQAAMAELMRTAMTVVQFSIRDDAITSYRVLPAGEPVELTPPVALTEVDYAAPVAAERDYPRHYRGEAIDRLLRGLDNSLQQRGPESRFFYVFANDGQNSCVALNGLDSEVSDLEGLSVLIRPHACR